MQLRSKRVALCGVLVALALILSYVESLIPFYFGVPGMKLGLTNLAVVFAMYSLSDRDAIIINILRIILAGFMFGNMFSIAYSLSGAILSFAVMVLMKRSGKFSPAGVSTGGGISHNLGQLIAACLIVTDYRISLYAPALIAAGAVTGFAIGITASGVLRALKNNTEVKE